MRTGERLSLSTLGAVGEEPKSSTLYSTYERLRNTLAIWVATRNPFRPMFMGWRDFFMYKKTRTPMKKYLFLYNT